MAFYKALENIELKKYSEASDDNFGVVFYSKSSLKSTQLFDKEVKGKVSKFFEDDSKSSLMVSKEFSGLSRDILFVRDFDKKKSEHKKEQWLMGVFAQLDKYNVESASIFADTSTHIKDKSFAFNIAKYAEKSAYRYTDTNPNTKKDAKLKELDICVEKSSAAIKRSVELGYNVGRGSNTARNLGNRPANHATPTYIANQVLELGKEIGGFKVDVLEEKDMKKLGMGSLLSVSEGSVEPAKLVTMQYNGGKKGAKPIVLVGKGVTFDTGGISLKPSPKMDEMKSAEPQASAPAASSPEGGEPPQIEVAAEPNEDKSATEPTSENIPSGELPGTPSTEPNTIIPPDGSDSTPDSDPKEQDAKMEEKNVTDNVMDTDSNDEVIPPLETLPETNDATDSNADAAGLTEKISGDKE